MGIPDVSETLSLVPVGIEGGQTPHCPMLGGARVEPPGHHGDWGLRTGSVGAGGAGQALCSP